MSGSDQVIQQAGDFLQTLSLLDYVIILGIGRGIMVGYKSGGFVELMRYVVLFLSLAVVAAFSGTLAVYLKDHTFLSEGVSKKAVIIVLGLTAYSLLKLITKLILKVASMDNNWVMKLIGVTLGGFRWAVLLSFGLYTVSALHLPVIDQENIGASRWGSAIEPLAPGIYDFANSVIPHATLDLK